jgi:hypothetical protein
MDKEIPFGSNILNRDPTTLELLIPLPDPRFCNSMLAIMRVLHGSGAAEVLDELRQDDEHSKEGGSSMGSSKDFDDLFVAKLHLVHMSQSVMVNRQE